MAAEPRAPLESTPLIIQRRGDPSMRVMNANRRGKDIVLIDESGHASYTTLRKQALVTDMQLRHRDIRALDPAVQLPYPSAIFVRKQALVLNLEGLKLIIGRDKMLVISVPSLTDLAARTQADLGSPVVARLSANVAASKLPFHEAPGADGLPAAASFMSLEELKQMQALPFELRALEAALLLVLKVLQQEVAQLEGVTHPVLARIRRSVARPDLEQLYEIQNRLDKSCARVGKIKEILEELLDDELSMQGLCLSRAADGGSPRADAQGGPRRANSAGSAGSGAKGEQACLESELDDEVGEAEDLIEAYWLQVDSALSRLKILQERITNTEHLVNLDLDAKRNALVALGLAVDLMLMCFEIHMAVTGIFGMNLVSGLERWDPYSLWGVASFGLVLGLTAMVAVGLYAKRRGLLYMPNFGLLPPPGAAGAAPPGIASVLAPS